MPNLWKKEILLKKHSKECAVYIMGQRSSQGTIPQSNLCTSDKKKTIRGKQERKRVEPGKGKAES